MRERDHINLEYEGGPGEPVTVRVKAIGTSHLVEYTLDGTTRKLQKGEPIRFNLKTVSGQQTDLQLVLDFNAQGSYEVTIENIPNCTGEGAGTGQCINTFPGPPKEFPLFGFFVK
jgi:hypothetical protein